MRDALELAAGLLGAAVSGKPFETERDRVEHHVRRARLTTGETIVWEGSMKAAVRRVLELIAEQPAERWSTALLEREWGHWPPEENALASLSAIENVVLEQGRIANRSSNVTPKRRLDVPFWRVREAVPAIEAVRDLVDEFARSLLADHEPRGWRLLAGRRPLDRATGEFAQAAAAGLFTGYVVERISGRPPRTIVLVPRPAIRVRRTPRAQSWSNGIELHAEKRPAVEWPDGTRVWYWHGVEIPNRIAERLDTLTPQRIASISNQEVRRLVLERVGWERFLDSADRVAQDDFGTLWDTGVRLEGERLRVVEVVNATEEPDGSRRRYVLRVPPTVRTAREAVAWTFGFDNTDDYILAAQT